jgi:hypothetical protein
LIAKKAQAQVLSQLRRFEREDLAVLLGVIDGSHAALKRDGDGWAIRGKRGKIVCDCGMFNVHIGCASRRHWARSKRVLSEDLCTITADGYDSGVLRLSRLPEGEEIDELRHAIGLRPTRPAHAAAHLHMGLHHDRPEVDGLAHGDRERDRSRPEPRLPNAGKTPGCTGSASSQRCEDTSTGGRIMSLGLRFGSYRPKPSRKVAAFERVQTVVEWARETGISSDTINERLKKGWPAEKSLTAKPGRWANRQSDEGSTA